MRKITSRSKNFNEWVGKIHDILYNRYDDFAEHDFEFPTYDAAANFLQNLSFVSGTEDEPITPDHIQIAISTNNNNQDAFVIIGGQFTTEENTEIRRMADVFNVKCQSLCTADPGTKVHRDFLMFISKSKDEEKINNNDNQKKWWQFWKKNDDTTSVQEVRDYPSRENNDYQKELKLDEELINSLKNNNPRIRQEAVERLGEFGEEITNFINIKAIELLISLLNDEDYNVRTAAAWALGNSGDKLAVEPLNNLLINEKGRIKMEVLAALKKIKQKSSNDNDIEHNKSLPA